VQILQIECKLLLDWIVVLCELNPVCLSLWSCACRLYILLLLIFSIFTIRCVQFQVQQI